MPFYKNVAAVLYFYMENTDGTENTSGTVAVSVAKDSGSFATASNTAVRTGSTGLFYISITATELNCDRFALKATLSGCRTTLDIYYPEADYTATVAGRIDAAISTRSSYAGGDTSGVTTLLSRIGAALTITSGKVDVNDKTGFSLSSGGVQAIWDAAVSALTTVGSIGKRLVDNLTGDIFARLGAPSGASVSADIATANTALTTLTGRLTSARAGYLDNLNVGGAVASNADVLALNQSASRRLIVTGVGQMERPESGSSTFTIELRTYDGDGAAANATATPTISPVGIVSGSLSANLSAVSNPATGVYRATYTVSSSHAIEQVRFDASAVMSDGTFTLSMYSIVCDFVASTFTAADRTKLADIESTAEATLTAASQLG